MIKGRSSSLALALALMSVVALCPPSPAADSDSDAAEADSAKVEAAGKKKSECKADEKSPGKASKAKRNGPSIEDMRAQRRMLRDDLMLPSLKGIRGFSYGIPGHCPDEELYKAFENGLKQLPVHLCPIQKLKDGETKPIDGVIQLKVLQAGPSYNMVELTCVQWCKLLRDPKIEVRSITYHDQAITPSASVRDVAVKMVNQFVIDYLKANGDAGKKPEAKAKTKGKSS